MLLDVVKVVRGEFDGLSVHCISKVIAGEHMIYAVLHQHGDRDDRESPVLGSLVDVSANLVDTFCDRFGCWIARNAGQVFDELAFVQHAVEEQVARHLKAMRGHERFYAHAAHALFEAVPRLGLKVYFNIRLF